MGKIPWDEIKLDNFESLFKESREQTPKRIRIFMVIRIFPRIRIIDQKIRIPPSGSQMTKKIQIPAPESRIRPASTKYLNGARFSLRNGIRSKMAIVSMFCFAHIACSSYFSSLFYPT